MDYPFKPNSAKLWKKKIYSWISKLSLKLEKVEAHSHEDNTYKSYNEPAKTKQR